MIALAALALAGGLGWYVLSDSADAAAVTSLDAESLPAFRNEFNQAAGGIRMVVLLSPT